jgi:hypothetical protein
MNIKIPIMMDAGILAISATCNNTIQTKAVTIAAAMLKIIDLVILYDVLFITTPKPLHSS